MKIGNKVIFILVLIVGLVGCEKKDTSMYEKVIDDYFMDINAGDTDKILREIDVSKTDETRIVKYMQSIEKQFDIGYGNNWNEMYKKYKVDLFKNSVGEYRFKNIKVSDNKIEVEVQGKYFSWEDYDVADYFTYEAPELEQFNIDYDAVTEEMAPNTESGEAKRKYQEVYDTHADAYFTAVLKEIEDIELEDFSATFTLKKKNNKWHIAKITNSEYWRGIEEYGTDYEEYLYEPYAYKVDYEQTQPENTILGKGNLKCNNCNEKDIFTAFTFIDYNITSEDGHEIDEEFTIDTSSVKLKFEIEVAGNIGDSFTLLIEDSDFNYIEEECVLMKKQMIFTKKITDFDPNLEYFNVSLVVKSEARAKKNNGHKFGRTKVFLK